MPRRYNPRAVNRQMRAWRAEHLRDNLYDARQSRRTARHVQSRLEAVKHYGSLRKNMTKIDVQAAIDDIELRHLNADRAAVGLPLFKTIEEALAVPPPPQDDPFAAILQEASDFS